MAQTCQMQATYFFHTAAEASLNPGVTFKILQRLHPVILLALTIFDLAR